MKKFEAVFLGAGPTAPTLFDYYERKMKGRGKYLLITEKENPEGAITKGSKVVNHIVPKLPWIKESSLDNYREIAQLALAAEIHLEALYNRTDAFIGTSEFGIRYCRSVEEANVLKSIQQYSKKADASLTDSALQFLQSTLSEKIEVKRLFSYGEKVWNVNRYLTIVNNKIEPSLIWTADRVAYAGNSEQGIFVEVVQGDGSIEKIQTTKLFICKGLGNIDFENNVNSVESSVAGKLNFEILKYYKRIYRPKSLIPQRLSSVFLPEQGVCVTNEQNYLHSLLYDTNSNFCPVSKFWDGIINE